MADEDQDQEVIKRKPGRPPKQDQLPANFTVEDVMMMMREMSQASDERMLKLVQEMRKPTEAEQKKIDNEKALLERRRENRRREMIAEEKARTDAQKVCPHKKKARNGSFVSAWGGQVNSDGYWYPLCTSCQLVGPEVKAPQEWITGGVNATDPEHPIWTSLDLKTLYEWQRRSGGPKPRVKPPKLYDEVSA